MSLNTIDPIGAPATRAHQEAMALEAVLGGTRWLSAAEINATSHGGEPARETEIGSWLQRGRVFAIDQAGAEVCPAYLFDASWLPLPGVQAILAILGGYSPMRIACWFESTNAGLDGRRPRELLAADPGAVFRAARRHVVGAVHG